MSARVLTSEKKGFWLACSAAGHWGQASREVQQFSVWLGPPSTCYPRPPLQTETPSHYLDFYNQNIVSLASDLFIVEELLHWYLGGASRSGLAVFLRSLTASM